MDRGTSLWKHPERRTVKAASCSSGLASWRRSTSGSAAVGDSSHGRLVLVAGEAGGGKTSLLRRFREQHHDGPRFLWGACDPLFTPRPLGPLLDFAELTGGELEEVVASGARPHEVVAALINQLGGRATVLVLEDLHWADEATLDVLRLLARRLDDASLRLSSPATATTSSTARTRCGSCSASWPGARRSAA